MPRISPAGVCGGVGDGTVSWNGVRIARGGCVCWLDQYRLIFSMTDGSRWWVATFDVRNGEIVELPNTTGANELAAGGGRWLAWQTSRGVYGSWQDPRAGLSLVDGDGRGGAGEDGTLAMIADRQTGVGLQLHAPSGAVALAPPGTIARQVHVLGPARAIWRTDAGQLETMTLPVPRQAGPAYGPRWVDVPGQTPWIVYWTPARGLIAHPIDSLVGVVIALGDQAFYHDARVVDGRLLVAYSRGQGERPEDLVTVPDILTWPRVDVTASAPEPEPEPDPDPDPDPDPEPDPEPEPEPDPNPDPDPEPEIPMPLRQQVAFGPNIGSLDFQQLFTETNLWQHGWDRIACMHFYLHNITSVPDIIGPNNYEAFVAAGAFKKLKAAKILVEVEIGGPGEQALEAGKRIADAGGVLGAVVYDHTLKEISPADFALYCHQIRAVYPKIVIGVYAAILPKSAVPAGEAFGAERVRQHLVEWDRLGCRPQFVRMDIDPGAASEFPKSEWQIVRDACTDRSIPLQMTVGARDGLTDAEYVRQAKARYDKSITYGKWDAVMVQSWATSKEHSQGTFTIPRNLPETDAASHTSVLRYVLEKEAVRNPPSEPAVEVPDSTPRKGPVRIDGVALADDNGPFLAVGASTFTALNLVRHEPDRLVQNFAMLQKYDVHSVRCLFEIGGPYFHDRVINPWDNEARWDADVLTLFEMARTHGLRVQIVTCAPNFSTNQGLRLRLMDRIATLIRGQEDVVHSIEIANEAAWAGYPHPQGTADLREMYRRIKSQTSCICSTTSPGHDPASYGWAPEKDDHPPEDAWSYGWRVTNWGLNVDFGTAHFDRDPAQRRWRHTRQPWEWPWQTTRREQVAPSAGFNDEPRGPLASAGGDENDPTRLAMDAVVTYISKMAHYTYHCNAGVWLGGVWGPETGNAGQARQGSNLNDHVATEPTLAALQKMRQVLPPDLANWNKKNWHWEGHPFKGSLSGKYDMNPGLIFDYCALHPDGRLIDAVGGVIGDVDSTAARACEFDIYDPVSWEVIGHHSLQVGEAYRLPQEAFVLKGRLL